MTDYLSLVIIFIKRTDRSQKRYFLWQILERDREGLRGGRWRRMLAGPHTARLEYWQAEISAEIRVWNCETTNKLNSFFLSGTERRVQSDILIKTFQSDTSQVCTQYFSPITRSETNLVSQDRHPDIQLSPARRLTEENLTELTDNLWSLLLLWWGPGWNNETKWGENF